MKIFLKNILFNNLGEIYYGVKRNFITPDMALYFCEKGYVKSCPDSICNDLEFCLEVSLSSFYDALEEKIKKSEHYIIIKKEKMSEEEDDFNYIPNMYKRIWELEFLLRAIDDHKNKETCVEKVYEYFYLFNFPQSWNQADFLIYGSNSFGLSYEMLYKNLISYTESEIKYFAKP